MRKLFSSLLLFAALTLLLPIAAAALSGGGLPQVDAFTAMLSKPGAGAGASSAASQAGQGDADAAWASQALPILNSATGEVETVSLRDFLIGAAASEMPISYQKEAFKAQIVAAHSYALANRDAQLSAPDPALNGAWFKANPAGYEGYIKPESLKTLWGDKYDANYAYLSALVDEVGAQVLTYDGAAALTTYYAISNGKTESSEAVWGTALPYLSTVDSPLDLTSPDYEQTVTLSSQDVYDRLNLSFLALDLSGAPNTWFGEAVRDEAGYIATMPVGGQTLKGTELRAALGLRSADFDVSVDAENQFTFTTRGYGHGGRALPVWGQRHGHHRQDLRRDPGLLLPGHGAGGRGLTPSSNCGQGDNPLPAVFYLDGPACRRTAPPGQGNRQEAAESLIRAGLLAAACGKKKISRGSAALFCRRFLRALWSLRPAGRAAGGRAAPTAHFSKSRYIRLGWMPVLCWYLPLR